MACNSVLNALQTVVVDYVEEHLGNHVYVVGEARTKEKKPHPQTRALLEIVNVDLLGSDPNGGQIAQTSSGKRGNVVQQFQAYLDGYLTIVMEGNDAQPAWEIQDQLQNLLTGFIAHHEDLPKGWAAEAPGMWMRRAAPVKDPDAGFYELGMRFLCNLAYNNRR